jgi:hypothetical protein
VADLRFGRIGRGTHEGREEEARNERKVRGGRERGRRGWASGTGGGGGGGGGHQWLWAGGLDAGAGSPRVALRRTTTGASWSF